MRELLLFVIGAAAGVISGMGMGGGTLLIPVLTLLMGIPQRQAQGVNMLSFLPAAAAALYIHKKEGRLELKSSLPVIAAGIVGALFGASRRHAVETAARTRLGAAAFARAVLPARLPRKLELHRRAVDLRLCRLSGKPQKAMGVFRARHAFVCFAVFCLRLYAARVAEAVRTAVCTASFMLQPHAWSPKQSFAVGLLPVLPRSPACAHSAKRNFHPVIKKF